MGRTAKTPPKGRKPVPATRNATRDLPSDDEAGVIPKLHSVLHRRKTVSATRNATRNLPSDDEVEVVPKVHSVASASGAKAGRNTPGHDYSEIRKALKKTNYFSASDGFSSDDDDEKFTPAKKKKARTTVTPDCPSSDNDMKKKKAKKLDLTVRHLSFPSNGSIASNDSGTNSISDRLSVLHPVAANVRSTSNVARSTSLLSGHDGDVATLPSTSSPSGQIGTPVSRISSVPAIQSLTNFGIFPANPNATAGNHQNGTRTTELRAVIINGTDGNSDILLRCEPVGLNHTLSWSEKLFSDAVRQKEAWVTSLNISSETFPWFHENTPRNNNRNYPIKLFYIPAGNVVTTHHVLRLCRYICERINSMPGNNTTLLVNESTLMWLQGHTVWSDVVGVNKACQMVANSKGTPFPGFYELHENFIHTYFHVNSFTLELMNYFHAPESTLHPNININSSNDENFINDQN
jgi:hypothetical protein